MIKDSKHYKSKRPEHKMVLWEQGMSLDACAYCNKSTYVADEHIVFITALGKSFCDILCLDYYSDKL